MPQSNALPPPENIPKVVYHYTSADALLSITESHRLRASSALGLNDREELVRGRAELKKLVDRSDQQSTAWKIWNLLNDPEFNNTDDENSVYVLSASSSNDDAAQWINYANGGSGYAIGIDTSRNLAITSPSDHHKHSKVSAKRHEGFSPEFASKLSEWAPVLYNKEFIEEEFEGLFQWANKRFERLDYLHHEGFHPEDAEQFFEREMIEFYIASATHSIIHRVKAPGWSAEREYRRVAVLHDGDSLVQFKAAAAGITGYVDLVSGSLGPSPSVQFESHPVNALPIKEIVAGPRTEAHDLDFVKKLLAQRKIENVNLIRSDVVLR